MRVNVKYNFNFFFLCLIAVSATQRVSHAFTNTRVHCTLIREYIQSYKYVRGKKNEKNLWNMLKDSKEKRKIE